AVFALVDCNNFYASCERLFEPALKNAPIIVLSNNDGCVIARSQESKDLGIKMAVPAFKIKQQIKQHNPIVFATQLFQSVATGFGVENIKTLFGQPILVDQGNGQSVFDD
ncbi:MAG: hypothetical protein COC23_00265, partial [Hyphomicrobiales bacterium]